MAETTIELQMAYAKRILDIHFKENDDHLSLDIPNIYDDVSGITMMRRNRCSCCSSEFWPDDLRHFMEKHFTEKHQLEIAQHYTILLMDRFKMSHMEKMSNETRSHLEKILDYMYDDESKHHAECCDDDGKCPEDCDHIFHSVDWMKDYLNGQ